MLERLVASERPRGLFRGTPGAALSITVHGLLIAGAVAATQRGAEPPVVERVVHAPMPWILATPETRREASPTAPAFPVVDAGSVNGLVDQLIQVPVTAPTGIPAPDAGLAFGRPTTGSSRTVAWPWAASGSGDPSAVVLSAVADEAPVLLTRPLPEYPPTLRAAGLEGTVMIEVIVDAAGLPEAESVRVVSSTHAQFEAAARRVVLGARYRPGRWRGRPVRVLIRQPVEFRLM